MWRTLCAHEFTVGSGVRSGDAAYARLRGRVKRGDAPSGKRTTGSGITRTSDVRRSKKSTSCEAGLDARAAETRDVGGADQGRGDATLSDERGRKILGSRHAVSCIGRLPSALRDAISLRSSKRQIQYIVVPSKMRKCAWIRRRYAPEVTRHQAEFR